jgi:hypothetical protein
MSKEAKGETKGHGWWRVERACWMGLYSFAQTAGGTAMWVDPNEHEQL